MRILLELVDCIKFRNEMDWLLVIDFMGLSQVLTSSYREPLSLSLSLSFSFS